MISTHCKANHNPPHVVAVFSFRYDAHLVPAMLANIDPFVDGWVSYDDRGSDDVFSNETRRRRLLLEAARGLGARWALAIDPDERFESSLSREIDVLTAAREPRCYTFPVREMYGREVYRVDGIWGQKRQSRLLPLEHGLLDPREQLHLPWSYFIPEHTLVSTDHNLYHLKMMTRERREGRAALYNFLDPERRMQTVGYDYLADDAGAEFEAVPEGRGYHPPHEDDGGLWMARVDEKA